MKIVSLIIIVLSLLIGAVDLLMFSDTFGLDIFADFGMSLGTEPNAKDVSPAQVSCVLRSVATCGIILGIVLLRLARKKVESEAVEASNQ